MRLKKYRLRFFAACFGLALVVSSARMFASVGQEDNLFRDPEGKYELVLPSNWKAVNYQDGAGKARVDIIYRDRAFGLLKITQESLSDNSDIDSFIRTEIDQNLRFRPGYVYSNTERFSGQYARGMLLEFDFSNAGQPKKGRHYYLKSNNLSLWALRFTGNRNILSPLRHETDLIARSFKPLQ